MANTPGTLVHKEHHEMRMEIRDNGELRSLYFADGQLQSRINLSRPWDLALAYTRYMAAALLLVPEPRRIAMIGLGAGALAQFFLHHFPQCRLTCVEPSRRVVALARAFFRLPESERLEIFSGDGRDFVEKAVGVYDLVLIDAFDDTGMAPSIYDETFLGNCTALLGEDGVAVCNLWSGNRPRLRQIENVLAASFTTVWYLPVPERGNIVAWATAQESPWERLPQKRKRLALLAQRYGIDFAAVVATARSNNLSLAQRLLLLLR